MLEEANFNWMTIQPDSFAKLREGGYPTDPPQSDFTVMKTGKACETCIAFSTLSQKASERGK